MPGARRRGGEGRRAGVPKSAPDQPVVLAPPLDLSVERRHRTRLVLLRDEHPANFGDIGIRPDEMQRARDRHARQATLGEHHRRYGDKVIKDITNDKKPQRIAREGGIAPERMPP